MEVRTYKFTEGKTQEKIYTGIEHVLKSSVNTIVLFDGTTNYDIQPEEYDFFAVHPI
jgi:hypothetical protein